MSAQVKKCFAEMTTYLGRDTKGLEKLKTLKDAVNVLRKDLAAAKAAVERAEAVKDAARDRADAAEQLQVEAEQQVGAAKVVEAKWRAGMAAAAKREAIVMGRLAEVNLAVNTIVDSAPCQIPVGGLAALMTKLLHVMPYCPAPVHSSKLYGNNTRVFDRRQLSAGVSVEDIWMLGAAVAVLSGTLGHVIIASPVYGEGEADRGGMGGDRGLQAVLRVNQWLSRGVLSEEERYSLVDAVRDQVAALRVDV